MENIRCDRRGGLILPPKRKKGGVIIIQATTMTTDPSKTDTYNLIQRRVEQLTCSGACRCKKDTLRIHTLDTDGVYCERVTQFP